MQDRANIALVVLAGVALMGGMAAAQSGDKPADTPSNQSKQLTVDEMIDAAVELLDRLDERVGEGPTDEEVAQLNQYITAIQAAKPDKPEVSYLYGRTWALLGRTSIAIEELRKFVETRQGRLEWKAFKALGDLFVGEYPRLAKYNYEKANELNPGEPSVLYGLSRAVYRIGMTEKALDLAKQAEGADRDGHVTYIENLARMYMANENWSDADRVAVKALNQARSDVEAKPGRRGPLVVLRNQYDLLVNMLQRRVQQPGPQAEDFTRIAEYVRQRGEVDSRLAELDALAVLKSGREHFTSNVPLLEAYAVLLAKVGRKDDAIEAFNALEDLDPDNAAAKEWLIRLGAPASSAESVSNAP